MVKEGVRLSFGVSSYLPPLLRVVGILPGSKRFPRCTNQRYVRSLHFFAYWANILVQYDDVDSFLKGDVDKNELLDIGITDEDATTIISLARQ
jgi:hypothetical protein